MTTIGVEFSSKNIVLDNQLIKLQLWDTAGQERFRGIFQILLTKAITNAYYRGAVGCLLLYDITNKASFTSLTKWLAEARENADENTVIMVLGNKTDLED